MAKKHFFVGFRKEFRDRLAASMGVEATPLKAKEVPHSLTVGSVYLRSITLLKLRPVEFLDLLKTCKKEGTKLVCLEEEFCFDPMAKEKKLRHTSLVQVKQPAIGRAAFQILNKLDYSYYVPEAELNKRKDHARKLIALMDRPFNLTAERIALITGLSMDLIQTFTKKHRRDTRNLAAQAKYKANHHLDFDDIERRRKNKSRIRQTGNDPLSVTYEDQNF